ncbi:uncharacterized protein EAF02_011177 [Botrytis sinoallii]|uniref:uncharacterized protein n=1 Tax=Botrytis sinoallii TaxID=1463999 RepID=UPI0018FFBC2B|nr:uncharacterized protein EAF02_011177 [Botrytis sinoallii]KAF7857810.1 hypothetical protein EAF02_011177 [Botrytis sinoallii]
MAKPETIGAISAVSALLESTISLLGRLPKTYQDPKNSAQILGTHVVEIQRVLEILELVKHEVDLRTTAVLSEIETIHIIATELNSHLEVMLSGEKSQARRSDPQSLQETKEQEALTKLMALLENAKSELGVGLNAARVEVTRLVSDKMNILNRVDELLWNTFGDDRGLARTGVVKKYQPRKTNSVDVARENIEDAERVSRRIVSNNVAREQALQINAPIGEKGWREAFQLKIRDNEAAGNSIQINHAISEDLFNRLLAHRN